MSIFENPNTTAVDDLYRYFKKGVFGTDNDSQQTSEEQQISYPQVSYPGDSPDVTEFNPIVSQIPNAFWYPEEIAFQNDRNAPRNIMKISIREYEGAQLKTNRFLREIGKGFTDVIKTEVNSGSDLLKTTATMFTQPGNDQAESQQYSQYLVSAQKFKESVDKTIDTFKGPEGKEAFEQTFNTNPLEATKLLATIFLYAPNDVEATYKFHYQDSDLSDISRLIDLVRSFDNNTETGTDVLKQMGVSLLDTFLDKSLSNKVITPQGQGINFKDFIQSRTKAVPLENWEYLFRRVSRRKFNFEYKLYPRSINEIKHVFSIINLLKYYAHPEKVAGSRYLNAPAVFHIEHMTFDGSSFKENLLINRIKPCALQQIDISYTEGGAAFTTLSPDMLQNTDPTKAMKSPVGINLKLYFEEMNILTRDDLTTIENFFKPIVGGDSFSAKDAEKYH